MLTAILILIIIACVLLTLVVLIQNPKGGGIAANFIAPNQIMGASRSTDVVEKATWILAITLIVLSLLSNFARQPSSEADAGTKDSRIKENVMDAPVPTAPQPVQTPAQTAPAQQQGASPAPGN